MRRCTIVGIVVVLTILVYKSLSVNAQTEDHHIPAQARKAGASLKRKFQEVNAHHVISDSHQQTSQEQPAADAIPSVYTKQNKTGTLGIPLHLQGHGNGPGGGESEDEGMGGEKEAEQGAEHGAEPAEDNYEYQQSEEEGSQEEECSEEMFWHIRGLRCVPFKCPGGNSKRNADTGECLHLPYSKRRYRYGYGGNYIGRSSHTNSKSRLTFKIFRG